MKEIYMPKETIKDLIEGKDAYMSISMERYVDCLKPCAGDFVRDLDRRVVAMITEIYIAYGGWVGISMEPVEGKL